MTNDIRGVLAHLRKAARSEREKGTYFERLAVAFLKNDPGMVQEYEDAWLFTDWAKEQGLDARDTGIDAVAKLRDQDGFCAIQCKFFREGYRLQKADIDSFFTASGKRQFARRLIIDTTDAPWSDNAEAALDGQQIETTRVGLDRLEQSPIDWSAFFLRNAMSLAPKKEPRPHQIEAIECVRKGFSEHERGKLIMACGTGKTFTGLKIAEELVGAGGSVLFLVPSLSLMSQSVREWTIDAKTPLRTFAVCSDVQIGKRRVGSDDVAEVESHDLDYPATTDAAKLAAKAEVPAPSRMTVVFATYQSIQAVAAAQARHGLSEFDIVICDEAHRTTGAKFPGEDESNFVKVHESSFIRGKKRLYMTATPRVFGDGAKTKASEASVELCSMDDEALFGPTFFTRGFGWAVQNGLLADYKVVVLAVDEAMVSASIQRRLADGENELKLDDATKIVGCYKALTKAGLKEDVVSDPQPMRRALAFCKDIKASKLICEQFADVVDDYLASDEGRQVEDGRTPLHCELRHVDGTFGAKRRTERLDWLKAGDGEHTCRILTNARCLSEGVDVPALDAILFLHPRKSQIDVVQSVGRVMRRAEGKRMGYVILPIGVPAGMTPEEALKDNERYRVVWQILNALRSHDERFDATINKLDLGVDVSHHIEVVAVSNKLPTKAETTSGRANIGQGSAADEDRDTDTSAVEPLGLSQGEFVFDEFAKAIMAKIVKKCGRRDYWEDWAGNIAKIAQTHITRITAIVQQPGSKEREAFERFVAEIRDDLNEGISESDAIEMLAQHLITRPVFEALFEGYSFTESNPVSIAMEGVLNALHDQNLGKEVESLEGFYTDVRLRAAGIDNAAGKQKIVVELYDKFFRNAFPRMTERLGIVYTPIEVVDFIIKSVNEVLKAEFGETLGSKGVHILDPFTGTGTFITRLLQSGLIEPQELARKYSQEIHANEIVLLAYYIAAVNIEAAYHTVSGENYKPFEGICLTDTFQLHEKDDLVAGMFENNSNRRSHQKALPIKVIIGNPPYSGGQRSEIDNAANVSYPGLDERIRKTYGKIGTATNVTKLFNSYVRALRWASDRVEGGGIVAFVTDAGWLDRNSMDGLRKCVEQEFSSVFVFHLRGDQRTRGETSRREGGKIFGQGSRQPAAISIFVKTATKKAECDIRFYDVGDYLTREDKLAAIRKFGSIGGISSEHKWRQIRPNVHGDWLSSRSADFSDFVPIAGSGKENRIFITSSAGINTGGDAWFNNFSADSLAQNMGKMTETYMTEVERFSELKASFDSAVHRDNFVDSFVLHDQTRIAWARGLKQKLGSRRKSEFRFDRIYSSCYRPFTKSYLYFDEFYNEMTYRLGDLFPDGTVSNPTILVPGKGTGEAFSALMVENAPQYKTMNNGKAFSRYIYQNIAQNKSESLLSLPKVGDHRLDNISDFALNAFRTSLGCRDITKDDIFFYIYAMLHSDDYKDLFADDLSKAFPRIPLCSSRDFFVSMVDGGRRLGELHLGYETVEPYPVIIAQGDLRLTNIADPKAFYRVEQMKFAGRRPKLDRTSVIYNANITMRGIPIEAYDYVVNGKPALEWVMERQCVKVDRASGIVNDANSYAVETVGDPAYPLKLFQRMITVSLETMRIVRSLPKLDLLSTRIHAERTLTIDDLKSGIRAYWGELPAASIALAIIDSIPRFAVPGERLELRDLLRMADAEEFTGELIAALAILTQSEFALFRSCGEFIDEHGNRHSLSLTDFHRVLTEDKVSHPVTKTEVANASRHVIPTFQIRTGAF